MVIENFIIHTTCVFKEILSCSQPIDTQNDVIVCEEYEVLASNCPMK